MRGFSQKLRGVRKEIEDGARTTTLLGHSQQKSSHAMLDHLNSFFARASILTNLLQSQVAVPLLYPLNSRSIGGDGIRLSNNQSVAKWDKSTLTLGLSQVAPAVTGLSKVATVLRAGHALRYFKGSQVKSLNKTRIVDASRLPQFNVNWHPRAKVSQMIKAETDSLHLAKKQVWIMRRPLFESETTFMGWRKHAPPPFVKGSNG